ncbi:MAG TPA: GNAT family N-acetyltransferase [Acidimicrobiales bacterium]|nr:GNAT family N-acetyltransferase [Acidimicrobiales bacterium]
MDAHLVPVRDLRPRQLLDWERLSRASLEPNPFATPGYVLPAASSIPSARHVQLALVYDGPDMVAALPVTRMRSTGPLRVLRSRSFQAVNLGTPLVGGAQKARALRVLLESLSQHADVLTVDWLGDGVTSTFLANAALNLGMPVRTFSSWSRPVLRRQDGVPECSSPACGECDRCALLSAKRSRGVQRWRRGLERQFGVVPQVVDQTADPSWPERFLAMEAAGWRGRLEPGTGALAQRPGYGDWFKASVRRLADDGSARCLTLEAKGTALAMFYMLETPAVCFACNMAYREDLRPYAPGVQLLLGSVRHFFVATGSSCFDSCTSPDNPHFGEFFPHQRRIRNIAIALHGWRSQAVVRALPRVGALGRRAKSHLPELSNWLSPG